MKLNIFNNQAELNEQLAKNVISIAQKAITEKGRFDFVLTGGSSPKELYRLLSTTYKNEIDWDKTYFFFGDERTVLPFEKDYNGLMAKEDKVKVDAIPANPQYTDTTYTAGTNVSITGTTISATDTKYRTASASANGLMSSAMFSKLNGLYNMVYITETAYAALGTKDPNTLYLRY